MRNVDLSQSRGCKEGEKHWRHSNQKRRGEISSEPAQTVAVSYFIISRQDPRLKSRQPLTHSDTLATLPPADRHITAQLLKRAVEKNEHS